MASVAQDIRQLDRTMLDVDLSLPQYQKTKEAGKVPEKNSERSLATEGLLVYCQYAS